MQFMSLELSLLILFFLFFYLYPLYFFVFIHFCPTCSSSIHNLVAFKHCYRDIFIAILARDLQEAYVRAHFINSFIEIYRLFLFIEPIAWLKDNFFVWSLSSVVGLIPHDTTSLDSISSLVCKSSLLAYT